VRDPDPTPGRPDAEEGLTGPPLPGEYVPPPDLAEELPAVDEAAWEPLQARRDQTEREILGRLNEEQARAVKTTDGPLLILAGAGSGKTRVLAHRVAYLIGVKGVRPWQVLAVTFTNKAAAEMRERILGLVGEPGREVAMGTFHALCARILRRDGQAIGISPRFTIYDQDDQTSLVKLILKEMDLPTAEWPPGAVLGAIDRFKNDLLGPEEAASHARTYRDQMAARVYVRYQERLRASNALDFDDLLVESVRLFEQTPEVLARYQDRWRYLNIDEYQDTNRPQYLWVKLLAAKHRNLAVVGDDDQSIYSWRGADLRNILDFERDYPDATVVKLERNYRSTQLILDAAHAVVSRNEGRKDKKLWTDRAGGIPIHVFEAYNEEEEAEWIARQVEGLAAGRVVAPRGPTGRTVAAKPRADRAGDADATTVDPAALSDIAVMYRTNAQSRAIEEAFLRYNIRYQLVGGTRFYQRREIKDALAYLRVLRNDHDTAAFERILNVPTRGIGAKTIAEVRARRDASGSTWEALRGIASDESASGRLRAALGGFVALIERLRARIGLLPLPELLDAVLEESGYRAMLADGTAENEERWANLLELRAVMARYEDLDPGDALDALLEETALVADQDTYQRGADAATLITLHAAKGLEFRFVFIAGLEEGLLPHARSLQGDRRDLEEERRLAYVGLTRAKERLFLSYAWRRATWGLGGGMSTPSRFLGELPKEVLAGPALSRGVEPGEDQSADAWEADGSQEPDHAPGPLDLELVFRRRDRDRGTGFRPTRDLTARRQQYYGGLGPASRNRRGEPPLIPFTPSAAGGLAGKDGNGAKPSTPASPSPPRPTTPGERSFRDGDRVRHPAFGLGVVVTSRITRADEEVTVAFRERGIKTLLASIAGLEHVG
jgi:DNA helicase-2/ATP-dependent DNA helicase PcrA